MKAKIINDLELVLHDTTHHEEHEITLEKGVIVDVVLIDNEFINQDEGQFVRLFEDYEGRYMIDLDKVFGGEYYSLDIGQVVLEEDEYEFVK